MELMVRAAAAAVTAVILSAVVRRHTPEFALLLILGAGLWIVALSANALGAVVEVMQELVRLTGIEEELFLPIVKTVAISLVARLTAEICRGAGEAGMAAFVEMAGTIFALVVSLPMIRAVVILMRELLG